MSPKNRPVCRAVVAFNVAFSAWMVAMVVWTIAGTRYQKLATIGRHVEYLDIMFIALLGAGTGLLVWIWERRQVVGYPRCVRCGYNLTGHVGLPPDQRRHCPECGEPLTEAHIIAAAQPDPRQADRRLMRLAGLAAFVSTVAAAGMFALLIGYGQYQWWMGLVLAVTCTFLWACLLLIRRLQREQPY